jgi:hypothetical protein
MIELRLEQLEREDNSAIERETGEKEVKGLGFCNIRKFWHLTVVRESGVEVIERRAGGITKL